MTNPTFFNNHQNSLYSSPEQHTTLFARKAQKIRRLPTALDVSDRVFDSNSKKTTFRKREISLPNHKDLFDLEFEESSASRATRIKQVSRLTKNAIPNRKREIPPPNHKDLFDLEFEKAPASRETRTKQVSRLTKNATSSTKSYNDPVFLKKFGIKTSVRYITEIVVNPICKDAVEQCWRNYQKKWETNTKQAQQEALSFSDCIDHSSPTGNDKWTNKYEVKWVNNKIGYGLFSKENYCQGEVLGFYSGFLTKTESVKDKDYAFDWFDNSFEGLCTDGALMSNATRYMNHASGEKANIETVEFFYQGLPYVMFVTKGSISPGTELLYDYGAGYWENKGVEPLDYL